MHSTPYDDEIQALLESLSGKKASAEGMAAMLVRLSPQLTIPPHLVELINILEASAHTPQKVLLSMPPQHGKSTTIKHAFPYLLNIDPSRTHAYITYADRLTKTQARGIRKLCQLAGVEMDKGAKALDHWHTPEGGGVIATSCPDGSLTGKKVDGLMVIDDPFKGRTDAESPVMREKVWEFFTDAAGTREHSTTSHVVVHTRWHEDDLIGRIKRELMHEGWKYINLPALNQKGEALWPDVHSKQFLENQRKKLGEYSFHSLYQGEPRPRGTALFQEPARYTAPTDDETWATFLEGKTVLVAVDPAASQKTSADYSVILTLAVQGRGVDMRGWVIDVQRIQRTVPDVVDMVAKTRAKFKCPVAVEAVGGFKAVPQMLERIDPTLKVGKTIIEIHPTVDKFQRAQPTAAAWNREKVLVPNNTEWAEVFIDEVLSFTGLGDRHDDQVDALSHAWNTVAGLRRPNRGVRASFSAFG